MVDEDAGELLADGLVDEDGGHGGIDAAGQPADHPLETHLLLILWTISVLKCAIDQSPLAPQISMAKFFKSRAPSGVWTTSMWNCVA